MLGLHDEHALHPQPRRALFELPGEGGPGIGHAGEALVAQVPEGFLPLLACRLDLPPQRAPRALFALRGAHDHPALPCRRLRRWRPEQVAFVLPGVVGYLQRRPRWFRGIGHSTDPAYPRGREPGDVLDAVEAAVGDEYWRLLGVGAQLRGQRLHRGDERHLVARVAVERLTEEGDIARPRG